MTTRCPPRKKLASLSLGTLDPPSVEPLSRHIDACGNCRAVLDSLSSEPDELIRGIRMPSPRKGKSSDVPPKTDMETSRTFGQETLEVVGKAIEDRSQSRTSSSKQKKSRIDDFQRPRTADEFCEVILWLGLISADRLQSYLNDPEKTHPSDAYTFARNIVADELLTKTQAALVYRGQWKQLALGEYTLLKRIGSGGMGTVYKALHRRMQALRAVKVMKKSLVDSPESVARFQREVLAAAQLSHPNIVMAHDAGEDNGQHYLVMEFVDGPDLGELVKRRGPLSVEKAIDYTIQAARGLAMAHEKGTIHRDIKPGNLLLGSDCVVKVSDLGLARMERRGESTDANHLTTNEGQIMGTVDFMSPEQAEDTHNVDHRTDIYSLGCTLYRLLTGKSPYPSGNTLQRILAHRNGSIPKIRDERPEVSEAVDEAFAKMVAKKPADRPQSMVEVLKLLNSCVSKPTAPPDVVEPPPAPAPPRRPPKKEMLPVVDTGESEVRPAPLKPAKQTNKQPWRQWAILGGAGLLGLVLIAALATFLFIRTPEGTIEIRYDEGLAPDIRVSVIGDEREFEITAKDDWKLKFKEGEYQLKLKGGNDEFMLDKEHVTVTRDGYVIVKISRKEQSRGLIELVDLKRDTVDWTPSITANRWTKNADGLKFDATAGGGGKVVLPVYLDSTNYELQVEASIVGDKLVSIDFPVAGGGATVSIGADNLGLNMSDGRIEDLVGFAANKRRMLTIVVKSSSNSTSIEMLIDGEPVHDWKGDAARIVRPFDHTCLAPGIVGLYANPGAQVCFHAIRLNAITGRADPLVPQPGDDSQFEALTGGPFDLLRIVDPSRDVIKGDWKRAENGWRVAGDEELRIVLPAVIEGDYSLRTSFTCNGGLCEIQVILPVGPQQVMFTFHGWDGKLSGFWNVGDGKYILGQESSPEIKPGDSHELEFDVSATNRQVAVKLDGEDYAKLNASGKRLWLHSRWRIGIPRAIGLGAWKSDATFHDAEVTLAEGAMQLLRPDDASDLSEHGHELGVELQKQFEHGINGLAVSPDGEHAIVVADAAESNRWVGVIDLDNGNVVAESRTDDFTRGGIAAAFLGNGKSVAIGINSGLIEIRRFPGLQLLATLEGHKRGTVFLREHTKKDELLSIGSDGEVRLWNLANKTPKRTLIEEDSSIRAGAVSPEGGLVAYGLKGGPIKVRSLSDMKEVASFGGNLSDCINLRFHPSQKNLLVTGHLDGEIVLWNILDSKEVRRFIGHERACSLCFLAHGDYLVSGSADHSIRIWDFATAREVHRIEGARASTAKVAITPDQRRIISGGGKFNHNDKWYANRNNEVVVWDLPTLDELRRRTEKVDDR